MSNFIYYEKLENYEEQVKKAKLCDEKDKEIERLNKRIKKAIEYVKTKNYCSDIFTKDFAIFDKQELLEILKGDGSNE